MRRSKDSRRSAALRGELAELAARVAIDSGLDNLGLAKRKAASQLGVSAREAAELLPRNDAIEEAIAARQRLFMAHSQPAELAALREVAREAMQFLAQFRPRLVGAVLGGTADRNTTVTLHLFADAAEEVVTFLLDQKMPFDSSARRVRFAADESAELPCFSLLADDTPVDLVVFSGRLRTRQPIDPVDGRPIERASLSTFDQLVGLETS